MSIWTSDGELHKTIDRGRAVQSVAWFPHGEAFVSVEGSDIRKLDLEGNILDLFSIRDTTIHDVVVTKDSARIICVATSAPHLSSDAGGAVDRKEEVIMIYNLLSKRVESQVPVLGELRNVKLSKDGTTVLVSYENKTPPQRWKINIRKVKSDVDRVAQETAFLLLEQTFMPRRPVDFAGPSHFGGRLDELVICVGKNGIIYVWDSSTGFLLHHYSMTDADGDLTCLAWNHESERFMFATGSDDGTVRIWAPKSTSRPHGAGMGFGTSIDSPRTVSPLPSIQDKAALAHAGGLGSKIDHEHLHDSAMIIEEELDPNDDEPVKRVFEFLQAFGAF